MNENQSDFAKKFQNLQFDIKNLFKGQEQDILALLSKKVDQMDFDHLLNNKLEKF